MKVMFHSNAPWVGSGYGQSVRWFGRALLELGHEVAVTAYHGLQSGVVEWDGLVIYPQGNTPYGNDVGVAHAKHFGADVLVPILDAWVLGTLALDAARAKLPLVLWSPVDQAPVPPDVLAVGKLARMFACFSRWGTEQAKRAGLQNVRYVPLGIDTAAYAPLPKDEARKLARLPADAYLAGIVSANKCPHSRKAWAQQMEGFSLFRASHPEAMLYIHADPIPQPGSGWNLHRLAEQYGITDAVIFADRYQLLLGYSTEQMRAIYCSLDVLLHASAGEGFGLPLLEAQACGVPVIAGDWTSMSELHVFGAQIDEADAMRWRAPQGGYWFYPQPFAVQESLEFVHRYGGVGDCVKDDEYDPRGWVIEHYSVERVCKDFLVPALEEAIG
jgi:glycosyltransferase involved in cell wall biosynthesis